MRGKYLLPPSDRITIAWMAGLLEGEGCFGFTRNRGKSYARIALKMTDEDIVSRVSILWGCKYHVQKPRVGNWERKNIFAAEISGAMAAEWMRAIYPFLGSRRKERIDMLV